jgi:hypothetical protein
MSKAFLFSWCVGTGCLASYPTKLNLCKGLAQLTWAGEHLDPQRKMDKTKERRDSSLSIVIACAHVSEWRLAKTNRWHVTSTKGGNYRNRGMTRRNFVSQCSTFSPIQCGSLRQCPILFLLSEGSPSTKNMRSHDRPRPQQQVSGRLSGLFDVLITCMLQSSFKCRISVGFMQEIQPFL